MSRFVLWSFRINVADHLLGVGYRGRDHVAAARPFSQVNQAAAIAAEREVGVGALYRFFADGATELYDTLAPYGAYVTGF
jgi:hypothetical protein